MQNTSQDPATEARTFATELFGARPVGSLLVVSIAPGWNRPVIATDPAEVVAATLGVVDAYVRLTTVDKRPKRGERAGENLTHAVLGIALDFDVDGSPDGRGGVVTGGFPDLDAAVDACGVLLEPTLVVLSGYGVQPHWLLTEPVLVPDAKRRKAVKDIIGGFHAATKAATGVRKLDSVTDLARVMRPPGSLNGKGDRPVPVTLIRTGGPRYGLDDFAPFVARNGHRRAAGGPPRDISPGRPAEDLVKRWRSLGKVVRHEGDTDVLVDGSLSEVDFHLCCEALRRVKDPPVTDSELADLIRHHRDFHDDPKLKGERADYVERTVAKAREEESGPPRGDAGETMTWVARRWQLDPGDPVEWVETSGYGLETTIRLTRRSGRVMRISRYGDLFDPAAHTRIIAVAGSCRCPAFGKPKAVEIAEALGEVCGVTDDPDAEPDDFSERLAEFMHRLGHEVIGDPGDWETLTAAVDWVPTEEVSVGLNRTAQRPVTRPLPPAERACGIRDTGGHLWLPAGALGDHLTACGFRVQGGRLRAHMEEFGFEHKRVDARGPMNAAEGVSREDRRHLVRVFYGEVSMVSMPNARAMHIAQRGVGAVFNNDASRVGGMDTMDTSAPDDAGEAA